MQRETSRGQAKRGESCGASRSTNLVIGLIRDMFLNLWRKQLGSWLLLFSESPQTGDVKKFREFNSLIKVYVSYTLNAPSFTVQQIFSSNLILMGFRVTGPVPFPCNVLVRRLGSAGDTRRWQRWWYLASPQRKIRIQWHIYVWNRSWVHSFTESLPWVGRPSGRVFHIYMGAFLVLLWLPHSSI